MEDEKVIVALVKWKKKQLNMVQVLKLVHVRFKAK